MSSSVNAYAAMQAKQALKPFRIARRNPTSHDVVIDIAYCGVCHSDIHQARGEWGANIFPMVPGHEIVGKVSRVGDKVSRFQVGDKVGVGCFVDACRQCEACEKSVDQYCDKISQTYNGVEQDGKTPTFGGYSTQIVVDENYVLRIPDNLPLAEAAPLLCAGITTYSPLRYWQVKKGDKVGVIGMGGLGHMAVKIAKAMGAEVSVISHSDRKKEDALKFGAKNFINTTQQNALKNYLAYFDLIINTVSADIDLNDYLQLLKLDGTMVWVGAPEKPAAVNPFPLIIKRRRLAGSMIGGIKETQEMLDFCGKHAITSTIEVIPIDQINEAYQRMMNSDVRYRFVIDIDSLR